MMLGKMDQWEQDRQHIHPLLRQVIDVLDQTDFDSLEEGRYELNGSDIYLTLSGLESLDPIGSRAEKHELFIDIHYLVGGSECIGWKAHSDEDVAREIRPGQDISLYESTGAEQLLELEPGMYAVFFPTDVHRPGLRGKHGIMGEPIKKVVVKVNSSLFKSEEKGDDDAASRYAPIRAENVPRNQSKTP
ncbi:hypothetical protein J23TS9_36430 [Paenibacillus sp. J23TS9]|uniref:YhcH/YjgK/YiaL family protein n=1 Tax=Paenibacillus sp. J23TS9 TaxID=2807193 RepID=UPI001B1EC568|nr:YhcH/YjgK/YiaL family protein [Paenibacillus sp. J23TS9]GIP28513.1 hypothetical protein J23TS9_36430 [Paenibacillus sp. J23TS9]